MTIRHNDREEKQMLPASQSKLVMIGDSVTDCGRARPAGEGLFGAHGNGYVSLVDGFLNAVHPEKGIRVINMGTSGNTVRDLAARWTEDVLALQPDWLSVMIGINDVWRQFDSPRITSGHVYLEEYSQTLESLVARTRPQLQGLVLMTPYFMEPNRQDPMRALMDQYGAACRFIAVRNNCIFVDTQAAFDELFRHVHPHYVAWDRIHPNHIGAALLSRLFLQAIEAWE
jgi:lysophospholipase L1-like esterase